MYATNKVRGGSNGRKGTRYEDFFAGFRVAQVAVDQLRNLGEWPVIEDQVFAFVDDLVLTTSAKSHYHQLKNVADLSWTSGVHSLEVDFQYQVALSAQRNESPAITTLIVSKPEVFDGMLAGIPAAIKPHSTVEHFPYCDGSFNRLVIEFQPLRASLEQLTRIENPTDDDLANVLGVLMIGLMQSGQAPTVEAVLQKAQSVSPSLLRLFPWQIGGFQLHPEFVNILAKIPNLIYGTSRGFFTWSALSTSGVLQFNCLSPEFMRFQDRVISVAPLSFDEFEELLP